MESVPLGWAAVRSGSQQWEEVLLSAARRSQRSLLLGSKGAEETAVVTLLDAVGPLRTFLASDEIAAEASRITVGEYSDGILVRSQKGAFSSSDGEETEEVVLATKKGQGEVLRRKIAIATAVLMFESVSGELQIARDVIKEVAAPFREALETEKEDLDELMLIVKGQDCFERTDGARAVAMLITDWTTALKVEDAVLDEASAMLLFQGVPVSMKRLKFISIVSCNLTALGAAHLSSKVLVSSALTELDLTNNRLEDDGAMVVSDGLMLLPSLIILRLGSNGIGSVGGRAIGASIRRISHLSFLDLHGNPLGDIGLQSVLGALGSLAYLEHLILYDCGASSQQTLNALVRGLTENTSISVCSGLEVLDLQNNSFGSSAVKKFLMQCSGLGSPQVIKLGMREEERLMMAMEDEHEDDSSHLRDEITTLKKKKSQVVDLGFSRSDERKEDLHENSVAGSNSAALEIVYGSEIAPFRLLNAITNLLGLCLGQVRLEPTARSGRIVTADLEFLCGSDEDDESCAVELLQNFAESNPLLMLLHVVELKRKRRSSNTTSSRQLGFSTSEQSGNSSVSVAAKIKDDGASNGEVVVKSTSPREPGSEGELRKFTRDLLVEERFGTDIDELRAHLKAIAREVSALGLFVPSETSEIHRYILEAKLSKEEGLSETHPTKSLRYSPLLSWAIAQLAQCGPSQALIIRSFVAAIFGDVEGAVAAAEQGKYALGLMLSLSQVTAFESAALQASLVSEDMDVFSMVMAQDLSEEEVHAGMIRLAVVIHGDLFARTNLVNTKSMLASPFQSREQLHEDQDPAELAGLVKELVLFERLNSAWTPRELALQFFKEKRKIPLLRAKISEKGTGFYKRADDVRVEESYAQASAHMSQLLLQAMGDAPRSLADPSGFGAAHEAFGIAYANRRIGLVDELVCQLLCQITCNPSQKSIEVGWRMLIIALRILEVSSGLSDILLELFDNRLRKMMDPIHLVRWCTEALLTKADLTHERRRARRAFAADASVRLDLLRQVLCDDDSISMDIHCWNGTGVRVVLTPFTSFEQVLEQIDFVADLKLRRRPNRDFQQEDVIDEGKPYQFKFRRWEDFVFSWQNSDGQREVLSWEADAYWWRWETALAGVLDIDFTSSPTSRVDSLGRPEPILQVGDAVVLKLETHICSPSLWTFASKDALRVELAYWQQYSHLLRGDFCTSNPEALGHVACLSACIQIHGGANQWLKLKSDTKVRLCLAHVPIAVRKRTAKHPGGAWMDRFAKTVVRFGVYLKQAADENEEFLTNETLFEKAFLAYLDIWPLANGEIFRDVLPIVLHRAGEVSSLTSFEEDRAAQSARFVVNSRGLFLLMLTRDAQTSRAIAVPWWAPLDEIMRLHIVGPGVIHISTRNMDQIECQVGNPKTLYRAIVGQCSANLGIGNPKIPDDLLLVEYAHRFPHVPWPPKPPPLYDVTGNPISLSQEILTQLDQSTVASVLSQLLLTE